MSDTMTALCADLRAENEALLALLAGGTIAPDTETPFMGWTVRDSVHHLVVTERLSALSFRDPALASAERDAYARHVTIESTTPVDRYRAIADYEDRRFGLLSWEQLMGAWRTGTDELCAAAVAAGDDGRVEWFGGAMRGTSLIAARLMEAWAYGQDVFDAVEAERPDGDRLRNVVEFGLKTFGFSFANRGEPVPPAKPHLALTSPAGTEWTWNDPQSPERITGTARDFALVVTQRRHVDDTGLHVEGPGATRWMAIAQGIAGAPMDGPPPRGTPRKD